MSPEETEQVLKRVRLPEPSGRLEEHLRAAAGQRLAHRAATASSIGTAHVSRGPMGWLAVACAAVFVGVLVLIVVQDRDSAEQRDAGQQADTGAHSGKLGQRGAFWVEKPAFGLMDDLSKSPDYMKAILKPPITVDVVEVYIEGDAVNSTRVTAVYQTISEDGSVMNTVLRDPSFGKKDVEGQISADDAVSYPEPDTAQDPEYKSLFNVWPRPPRKASLLFVTPAKENGKFYSGRALFQALTVACRHSRKYVRAGAVHALRHYQERTAAVEAVLQLLDDKDEVVREAAWGSLKALIGMSKGSAPSVRKWWGSLSEKGKDRLMDLKDTLEDFEEIPLELRQRLRVKD